MRKIRNKKKGWGRKKSDRKKEIRKKRKIERNILNFLLLFFSFCHEKKKRKKKMDEKKEKEYKREKNKNPSKSNDPSYFIMLAHNIWDRWWYGNGDLNLLLIIDNIFGFCFSWQNSV